MKREYIWTEDIPDERGRIAGRLRAVCNDPVGTAVIGVGNRGAYLLKDPGVEV